jgi:hypothetical protein
MSAAPPEQDGEGHLTVAHWIAKLASRGYRLHEEWTDELRTVYSDNMMIFARSRPF